MLLLLGIVVIVGMVIAIAAATHGLPVSSGKLGGDGKGLRDPKDGPG